MWYGASCVHLLLRTPLTVVCQVFIILHEISRQEYWSGCYFFLHDLPIWSGLHVWHLHALQQIRPIRCTWVLIDLEIINMQSSFSEEPEMIAHFSSLIFMTKTNISQSTTFHPPLSLYPYAFICYCCIIDMLCSSFCSTNFRMRLTIHSIHTINTICKPKVAKSKIISISTAYKELDSRLMLIASRQFGESNFHSLGENPLKSKPYILLPWNYHHQIDIIWSLINMSKKSGRECAAWITSALEVFLK